MIGGGCPVAVIQAETGWKVIDNRHASRSHLTLVVDGQRKGYNFPGMHGCSLGRRQTLDQGQIKVPNSYQIVFHFTVRSRAVGSQIWIGAQTEACAYVLGVGRIQRHVEQQIACTSKTAWYSDSGNLIGIGEIAITIPVDKTVHIGGNASSIGHLHIHRG